MYFANQAVNSWLPISLPVTGLIGISIFVIPDFGYKKYIIVWGEKEQAKLEDVSAISELENQWCKITIDDERAAISSLCDKNLNKELLDQEVS